MRKFIFVIVILLLSQVSMAQTYIDAVVVNEGKDTIFGKIMEINDSTITIDRFNYIFSIPKDLVVSYQANVREASRYERIHMEQMDNLSEKDFGYQTSGYYLRKSSKNFYLGMCLSVAGNTSIIIPLVTHDKLTIADQATLACGIAVSDTLQMIANGLCTVPTGELMSFLENYFKREPVDVVVFGLPRQMNNQDSQSMQYITPFVNRFKVKFPEKNIEFEDERFTSQMAFQTMIDSGLKKKDRQNKALVDQVSATIILQSYLENKKYKV